MGSENQRPKHVTRAHQVSIRRLFDNLPKPFEERYRALLQLHQEFKDALSEALEPALREHLELQPQATNLDRTRLTIALGDRLKDLGLSLACHRTKQLVTLTLDDQKDVEGLDGPPSNRYVLVHTDPLGIRTATQVSEHLPEIHVVDGIVAWPEPMSDWSVNAPRRGQGR